MTKTEWIMYGFSPIMWRMFRAKQPGMDVHDALNKDGEVIGQFMMFRYEATVELTAHTDFNEVAWYRTIKALPTSTNKIIGPDIIPPMRRTFM